jgi:hypothetical protein
VYVPIGADSAVIGIDVAFVREIIRHGAVWTTSIVRLHNSAVASRVTMNKLIGKSGGRKKEDQENGECVTEAIFEPLANGPAVERFDVPAKVFSQPLRAKASAYQRMVVSGSWATEIRMRRPPSHKCSAVKDGGFLCVTLGWRPMEFQLCGRKVFHHREAFGWP